MIDQVISEIRDKKQAAMGHTWLSIGRGGRIGLAVLVGLAIILGLVIGRWGGSSPQAAAAPNDSLSLYSAGQKLQAQGDCSHAIALFAKAVGRTPFYVNALVGEAQCYEALHLYPSAFATLDSAVARDPRNWDTLLARAQLEAQLGQEGRALVDTRTALGLAPKGEVAALTTAQSVYSRLNDTGDAITSLSHAIAIAPYMATLYTQRAGLWASASNDGAADADYSRAAALSSGMTRLANLQLLGDQAVSVGETSDARAAYDNEITTAWGYLRRSPRSAAAHLMLAHALFTQNDRSQASHELSTAIALGTNDTVWMTALQEFGDWAARANAWPMAAVAYHAEIKSARAYLRSHRGDLTASALLTHATSQLPTS